MNYSIISDRDLTNLIDAINRRIECDWIPIGGLIIEPVLGGQYYHQTIIKKEVLESIK